MTVYLIEEWTWDHHEIVKVFDSEEKALAHCNKEYEACEFGWRTHSYQYGIDKREVE